MRGSLPPPRDRKVGSQTKRGRDWRDGRSEGVSSGIAAVEVGWAENLIVSKRRSRAVHYTIIYHFS